MTNDDTIVDVQSVLSGSTNGGPIPEPSLDELERELPVVMDGQIPLGELLSRAMQSIYAELLELAETMPHMSDAARKRILADWVVKMKKQVVKLYAVAKWSRDADTVQKCMNITAFLMNQNRQFEDAMVGLKYARESLDPARLRNHDLLTSLDVLTTGSYRRLPTIIQKTVIPPTPLTDSEIVKTLVNMEHVMRCRLRLTEMIPVEMSCYRISNGRVYFTAPKLFEASLCLRGAGNNDGWFFVGLKFLIRVTGDMTGTQEFPTVPTGPLKRFITDEADAQLSRYLPIPEDAEIPPPAVVPVERPRLPEGAADTPLARVFNFLQIMAMSYQLEILWYQAERMRSLGWAEYLTVTMSANRKKLEVSYWIRGPPVRIQSFSKAPDIPLRGGTLTLEISPSTVASNHRPFRTPRAQAMADLQQKSKLGSLKPSDEIEGLKFEVTWQPAHGALGALLAPEDSVLPSGLLCIDADNLDFESMLSKVLDHHTTAVLRAYRHRIQQQPRSVFAAPGVVDVVVDDGVKSLRVQLCAEEVVFVTIDPRTGRLNLRDTGDLAAAGRAQRFVMMTSSLNENPAILWQGLIHLRFTTITEMAEQKCQYLGLHTFRQRNFMKDEVQKLGLSTRATLYIQLSNFQDHYLVIVVTDDSFRYALITTSVVPDSMFANLVMGDIAWLDFDRIHGKDFTVRPGSKPRRSGESGSPPDRVTSFELDTQVLRELYSYCCARVAYMNVERQFKLRAIPFTHVNPTSDASFTAELAHMQSSLARSVPALCVQSKDILSGAPAAEAAMPNIRVIPLNWWSEKNAQVVTCVKLKYVQQPMGKTAGTSAVIRPSKRIIYDTREAVVSFLSENVNTCVNEFLDEWARVSKMVVIAREVAQMAKEKKWADVRLLSFDLQTVEFAYAADYAVSISCDDQLAVMGNTFELRFSRCQTRTGLEQSVQSSEDVDMDRDAFNPHEDAEVFLKNVLRPGQGQLAPSLHRLVAILRSTLPIATVLEDIHQTPGNTTDTFPKAAGWYRLLYEDLRHALDFRLMTDNRVAILDASYSLFEPADQPHSNPLGLQRIPGFQDIILDVVRESNTSGLVKPRQAALIDVGIVCDAGVVRTLALELHKRMLAVST